MQHSDRCDWSKFEVLEDNDPTSIIWASRGGDGSGKSYFAVTAPGPIFVCAFDQNGMDRVDKKVRAEREIRIGRYGFNPVPYEGDRAKIKAVAMPIWERFLSDYWTALKSARTVLWDREDMSWGLRRYAAWGGQKNETSRTGALDYGDLNEEYIGLLQAARDAHVNLGLIQGLSEKWVSKYDSGTGKMKSYNTGEMVPDGFKRLADFTDITLDHSWDPKQKEYVVTRRKFPNKAFKDTVVANLTFGEMAIDAFPDSDVALWM